jgi:hypothetical protein
VVRRYHDGPTLLDMLVVLSVGDPPFPGVHGFIQTCLYHLFVVPTAGHSVQTRAAGNPAEADLARFLG